LLSVFQIFDKKGRRGPINFGNIKYEGCYSNGLAPAATWD
jgi:hypothetical protein